MNTSSIFWKKGRPKKGKINSPVKSDSLPVITLENSSFNQKSLHRSKARHTKNKGCRILLECVTIGIIDRLKT
ncbi:hypothetical protein HMPREF9714_03082 [Myroides odoratimimus CCUG 12901]|nr:hypothetical protein HMPREF9714_03082 [Myroides odoratimimus CCUG 12901]